jgi:hypothetical protein
MLESASSGRSRAHGGQYIKDQALALAGIDPIYKVLLTSNDRLYPKIRQHRSLYRLITSLLGSPMPGHDAKKIEVVGGRTGDN